MRTSAASAAGVGSERQDNKALTRRWFEQVWNQRREATIDELFALDAVAHGLGEPLTGPAGFKTFFHTMLGAFPDLRVELHELLGDGDLTAIRLTLYGTHRGDLSASPAPTSRSSRTASS
jgi:predicted ester cyclase